MEVKKEGEENTGKVTAEMIQKELQKQIEKNQKLTELIGHRDKFIKTRQELEEIQPELKETEDFENVSLVISFSRSGSSYRDEPILKISNALIIREFINLVKIKIDSKLISLEKQIIG